MELPHHHRAETDLRTALGRPGPGLVTVTGPRGAGVTTLLRRVLGEEPSLVWYRAAPVPDALQRELLRPLLRRWSGGETEPPTGDWDALMAAVADEVARTRRRLVLVVDDAHHLAADRKGIPAVLAQAWGRLRARTLPVHLVLAGPSPWLDDAVLDPALREARTLEVVVPRLEPREVGAAAPGLDPLDRLRLWAVSGGLPGRLRHLAPAPELAEAIRTGFLVPGAPLATDGLDRVGADLQSLPRYLGLLRALAAGATSWAEVRQAAAGVESGGQMAPYLARLEELGHLRVARSLDAGPRSRRRRYHLTDPGLAFWLESVLPRSSDIQRGRWDDGSRERRPRRADPPGGLPEELDGLVARLLPDRVARHLLLHGDELLPAAAREAGALWGPGYHIPVAATLRTGAVVYGDVRWGGPPLDEAADDRLQAALRETRYGFGREARIRLLVGTGGFTPGLRRRAARERLLVLLDARTLTAPPGEAGRASGNPASSRG